MLPWCWTSLFSAEMDELEQIPTGSGRMHMSAYLKRVQQFQRQDVAYIFIIFYPFFSFSRGLPCIEAPLEGRQWAAEVLSFWQVFHLLSYSSPRCFHSVVSCRVYIATRLLPCTPTISRGRANCPKGELLGSVWYATQDALG